MAGKTFRSTAFKRAIDTGKLSTVSEGDLIKVWRVAQGDEKSISLADLAVGVVSPTFGVDNRIKVIYINPSSLSGVGTLASQIVAYINSNILIESTLEFSKINIVLGTDPISAFPYTLPLTLS